MTKKDVKDLIICLVAGFVIVGLLWVLVAQIAKIPHPPVSKMQLCLDNYNYDTCRAIETCGGLGKVSEVITGGIFGIGEGFRCKDE